VTVVIVWPIALELVWQFFKSYRRLASEGA